MIKDNTETAIALGLKAIYEWSYTLKESVLKKACFLVGYVNQDNKVRNSHEEEINVSWLSLERQLDVKAISDAQHRIWEDMKDPAKYYDRSNDLPEVIASPAIIAEIEEIEELLGEPE